MRYTFLGVLYTALIWAALICANAVVEVFRGNPPFAFMEWGIGGKFVTLTFLFVLALGGAIGYASGHLQKQKNAR